MGAEGRVSGLTIAPMAPGAWESRVRWQWAELWGEPGLGPPLPASFPEVLRMTQAWGQHVCSEILILGMLI